MDGRLRVVLLIDELEVWGGTETHLQRLLTHLAGAGIDVSLATIGACGLAGEFRDRGVRVEPLDIFRALAPSGLRGVGRIATLLRREGADLLVTYHTAADLLGPVAARLVGVPALSCRRDEGFTKKRVHAQLQRLLNPLLVGMIAVSHAVASAVERSEGYPRRRVQVIWNGEDLSRFRPGNSPARAELSLGPDDVVLICVGSLTPVKEHATLLRGFAGLVAAHPDARLLIVGDGPLRRELAAMADALAPRHIRFLGHRHDVPDLLRAADIYVQTSRTEGFSNAILQAMATGLPVVASAVGGNLELVVDDCGSLFHPGRLDELTAALSRLLSDGELRRRNGHASRMRAERCGSIEVMAEAYADAFRRATEGRFPGPSSGDVAGHIPAPRAAPQRPQRGQPGQAATRPV